MPNELKPCPFCGGSVSIARMSESVDEMWYCVTRGKGENRCTCRVFMESDTFSVYDLRTTKTEIKNKLIEAWNRRADNG